MSCASLLTNEPKQRNVMYVDSLESHTHEGTAVDRRYCE